ncbi:hypothetical protein SAMN02983003_3735 [Devosia enhydra]|uniref:Nucleotidyltransferase n=1 Tax=Devosia enhydra TaxID=665118 RepID=A0A1K2I2T2_9HYPH|nr:hypothetical protein [Devosia enhydra]SFZ86551.1 hypothetical protein SAMN02983003_3735 [Devosia enhydra]
MTADDYLRQILAREAVDDGPGAPLRLLEAEIVQILGDWIGSALQEVAPGGAFEKGTANASGVAIDFVAFITPDCPIPIEALYESLHLHLHALGLDPVRRPVSIGIRLDDMMVDIIPARLLPGRPSEVRLYNERRECGFDTNMLWHRHDVRSAGRAEEIRLIKLWRDQNRLELPSLYLEFAVIAALRGKPPGALAMNLWSVLAHFSSLFVARAAIDPANANNFVSDMLTTAEKQQVKSVAQATMAQRAWQHIVV